MGEVTAQPDTAEIARAAEILEAAGGRNNHLVRRAVDASA